MLDSWDILLALSGWGAWLSKEIISKLLDHRLTRTGRLGVIEGQSRIVCDTNSSNVGVVAVDYFPEMSKYPQYSDCRRFRVEFECQFFNDTDTQVVYTETQIEFWGVEGVRLRSSNPRAFVSAEPGGTWQDADAIAVPAHYVTRARFEVLIGANFTSAEKAIRNTYGETVSLLRTHTIGGKAASFRLCTRSFAGPNIVVWPLGRKYPIFSIYSLNRDGHKAGRRPQQKSAKENAAS